MNTADIRQKLKRSNNTKKFLMLEMADEIDRLERKTSIQFHLVRQLSQMLQMLQMLQISQPSKRLRKAA